MTTMFDECRTCLRAEVRAQCEAQGVDPTQLPVDRLRSLDTLIYGSLSTLKAVS